MNRKILYDVFHSGTTEQKRIINDNNFTYRLIISAVNKYISSGKKILDIGCGAGTISFYLAKKRNHVVGIDISQKAIVACQKSAMNLNLSSYTDFQVVSFPDELPKGTYDVVIFTEVIEHLQNDKKAIEAIYKLLGKKGIAIISTPSLNAPLHRLGLAKTFDKRVGHLRRYTQDQLVSLSENAGFKVLDTYKTEGILRNSLFLNPILGKLIRFIRFFISDILTFIDNLLIPLFGESNIFIILQKQ